METWWKGEIRLKTINALAELSGVKGAGFDGVRFPTSNDAMHNAFEDLGLTDGGRFFLELALDLAGDLDDEKSGMVSRAIDFRHLDPVLAREVVTIIAAVGKHRRRGKIVVEGILLGWECEGLIKSAEVQT